MTADQQRPGEVASDWDPAVSADDARLVFIGHVRSPWRNRGEAPRNLRQARERHGAATLEIDAKWRPALAGLDRHPFIVVLYWMHEARRDLLVQAPRHATAPAGTFALRSPVRPNPVAMAVVRPIAIDAAAGRIDIDAIDCLDGTPIIDIKPWFASVDIPPDFVNEHG